MRQTPLVPLRDSISTQLLKVVFSLYLILVITVTLLQLFAVYMQTKASVLHELKIVGATIKPGLEQALWEMNLTQMHSITAGIVQLPSIVGVRVEDDQGNTIKQLGEVLTQQGEAIKVNGEGIQINEPPTATLFGHEFTLSYTRGDQEFLVGAVSMYSSSTVVFERIRFGFLLLIIAAVIQIAAFGILFLWISRTKLSHPLAELTHAAGLLDLENLENITIRVHTSGRNELKLLEETFNAMVQKLLDARTTLYEYANELQQSRQQLQDILDNASAVIFLKDTNGRYLLINRQYEAMFHVNRSLILGKTDYDVFPKEMADTFWKNDQLVIATKKPLEVEESAPHDDGIHTYMSIKFPLHDVDDEIYGVCGIATDISERKKAEEHIKKLNLELEQRVQERTARLKEINTLLAESEQRLKEAQRIALLGNWDWDIPSNTLFWSDEIYRIFGVDPQEFDASYKAFLDRIHPEDKDVVEQAVHVALYENRPYSIDHRIVRPDGTIRIVHEQGEVTFDEQGNPIRMLGTVQDVSERKRTEEALRASEHQLRLIADNTPAYIAYVGIDDLCYRFVNRHFEIAYARPRDQIIGHHLKDIIGEANFRFALQYIEKVKTGEPASYVNLFPLEQGTRWIQVNYVPDFDERGKVRAIVVMSHDISEQKNTEVLLQQAKETAEAASRAKSTFLSNMSHELRTPLNSILGFAQILRKDRALTDHQRGSAEIIYRNGEHLLALLNDVLDFTKIEISTLELHPEKFVLSSLLRQLADVAQFDAEHKGLSFTYEAPAELPQIVFADQKRLRQILMNLLGNAVKFTKQGGVTFEISDVRYENLDGKEGDQSHISHLTFKISDTGLGIPPDRLETIFQPFQQADPYQLQEGSPGLGLAISRRLVEMMGSQLYVTSSEGQGSVFWFDMKFPVIDIGRLDGPQPKQNASLEKEVQEMLTGGFPVAAPPADWLAAMTQAVEETDIDAMFELITQLRKRDPSLADMLSQLANDFEYETILQLIQQTEEK